jgi:hypothetical protein
MAVEAAGGSGGAVLAFEEVVRDFTTLRINTWTWSGTAWQPVGDSIDWR